MLYYSKTWEKKDLSIYLIDVIMDSYKNTTTGIRNQDIASVSVAIRKGVKQRYFISSLLFNICIDPIFGYIIRK
jgi:hypothetical protein